MALPWSDLRIERSQRSAWRLRPLRSGDLAGAVVITLEAWYTSLSDRGKVANCTLFLSTLFLGLGLLANTSGNYLPTGLASFNGTIYCCHVTFCFCTDWGCRSLDLTWCWGDFEVDFWLASSPTRGFYFRKAPYLVLGWWLWLAPGKCACLAFRILEASVSLPLSGALHPGGNRTPGPPSLGRPMDPLCMFAHSHFFLALWVS